MGTPSDFGAHHFWNSSARVQASNTICTGPSKMRVTTSSRSEACSILVRPSPAISPIVLLLALEGGDGGVERVEAVFPDLAAAFDPGRLFIEPALAEPAGAHAPHLLGGHHARLLEDADLLLHVPH